MKPAQAGFFVARDSADSVITKPAKKTAWGSYIGYFADPWGYLWEVAHNPFFWVGPNDV